MPRILVAPDYVSSTGAEAIELAALAGLELDPWQALVLEQALGEADDGRWAAVEVGLCVPRQNGKNAVLEARELAALFLNYDRPRDEREHLVIHSAQQFKTAKEHFLRLLGLIEGTPMLSRRVERVVRTHGEEAIHLRNGNRILFFARTKSAGRGFTAPLLVFDEAMYINQAATGAQIPTMVTIDNRQRWYTGSAVDETVHPDGVVFARIRERALAGDDPRLAYFEWSLDVERPELVEPWQLADEDNWARSNPGHGIRISSEAIADELRALDRRTFSVERLGVGAWPPTEPEQGQIISAERWAGLVDERSEIAGRIAFAYDVSPDRTSAAIAAAGRREDGRMHVEVIDHERGAAWVVPRLVQLRSRWQSSSVGADGYGPAGALVHRLEEQGVNVQALGATDAAKACGLLVDLVNDDQLRHLGSGELASALRGATSRPLGDAWAWSRKHSNVDITPLVAVTNAVWLAATESEVWWDFWQ